MYYSTLTTALSCLDMLADTTCAHTATTAFLRLGPDLQLWCRTNYYLRLCDQPSLGLCRATAHAWTPGCRSCCITGFSRPYALLASSRQLDRDHSGELSRCQARNCTRPAGKSCPEQLANWRRHGWLQDRCEEPGTKCQLRRRKCLDTNPADVSDLRCEC